MKKIKMQLFGSFFLTDGDSRMGEDVLRSNKLLGLLVFILLNRDVILTHQKLIETFWGDDSRNPEGALKNLMYRLRTEMKALGADTYICTSPGAYRWNPEIEVETDYEDFEYKASQLKDPSLDQEAKKQLCIDIIESYRGGVSAKIAIHSWIVPQTTWYQTIYMDTMKILYSILEEEKAWSELEIRCSQALQEDPFDEEIHCWLIRSLHLQKKYDQALLQYEKAKKSFYEDMGIRSPEKLQEAFRSIMEETGEEVIDITSLLDETREKERPKGVFFCDYQIFRQIYRIEARRIDRLGVAEHILLLTVRKKDTVLSGKTADRTLAEGMKTMEQTIRTCLRAGDVAARYSSTQFMVLLSMCTYESGVRVAERLSRSFRENIGKRNLEIVYELAEISAAL